MQTTFGNATRTLRRARIMDALTTRQRGSKEERAEVLAENYPFQEDVRASPTTGAVPGVAGSFKRAKTWNGLAAKESKLIPFFNKRRVASLLEAYDGFCQQACVIIDSYAAPMPADFMYTDSEFDPDEYEHISYYNLNYNFDTKFDLLSNVLQEYAAYLNGDHFLLARNHHKVVPIFKFLVHLLHNWDLNLLGHFSPFWMVQFTSVHLYDMNFNFNAMEMDLLRRSIINHDVHTDEMIANWKAKFFTLLFCKFMDKTPYLLEMMGNIPLFANRMALELRLLPTPLNQAQKGLFEVLKFAWNQPNLEWGDSSALDIHSSGSEEF
jgi:hypothetical protein